MKQHGELEVFEDEAFQRAEWRWQRFGWGLMLLVVAASAAGLFGDGPLSRAQVAGDGGRLVVDYDRFARRGTQTSLRVSVDAQATRTGVAEIRIARDYADTLLVETIAPEPFEVAAGDHELIYRFRVSSGRSTTLSYALEPAGWGLREARIRLADGTAVRFRQLVYP